MIEKSLIKEIFPSLYEEDLLNEIAREGKFKSIPSGELIMDFGQNIRSMPLIVKGSVKVLRQDDEGNEMFMYYVGGGNTCAMSLTCCMRHMQSEVRAIAEDEVEMITVPVEFMDRWMNQYQSWKNFVMETYRFRFEELLNTIDSIAFLKLDERLIHYLEKKEEATGNRDFNITHQEIANDLGSSREVVSRLLKQLEKKGVVELGRNKIKLL